GLNYARGSYQMQLGKATAGVAYSWLGYELGREFAGQGDGTAKIASIYGSYPLIRSRNTNLYALLAYDDKTLHDNRAANHPISSVSDRKARVLTGTLRGDHRDNLGGGGLTGYSLALSSGKIDIRTPSVRINDANNAQTNGHFNKLGFSAMRLQSVTDTVSLYAGINGQLASKNLDSSEQMELGGMNAVRAYPEGEAFADEGYVLTLEARMRLPKPSEQMPGQVQLIGFVDTGSVRLQRNPLPADDNRRTLSGAGVGLTWAENNNFMVRTYYARKLGSGTALSAPDKSGRFWIQGVKYF
ncbi:MAG: ShlB/FhaC/HecB family hemolysin secretion/activation protein, partial [Polaromonas sp.]